MTIEHIWPDALHTPRIPGYDYPPFAQVVQITRANGERSIHISGTFGSDTDGTIVDKDHMGRQVAQAFENIRLSIEAVGGSVADIVRVKVYVTDMDAFRETGLAEYMKFKSTTQTASTLVEISRLANPDALVEIEAYGEIGAPAEA